jgi:hypothetical protein
MYNVSIIENELLGVVGWQQQVDAGQPQIVEMLTSESGLFYDDIHPLVNMDIISEVCPEFDMMTFEVWSAVKTYPKGYFVKSGVKYYRSIQANNLNHIATDVAWWVETTPFTNWLRNKTLAGIKYGLNKWLGKKFDRKTMRNLLSDAILFPEFVENYTYTENTSKNVGLKLRTLKGKSMAYRIRRISFQFKEPANFAYRLFKVGTSAAVQTGAVTYSTANQAQWVTVNWDLEPNSTYYLVYDETAIGSTNKAVNIITGDSVGEIYEYYPTSVYFDVCSFSKAATLTTVNDLKDNTTTLDTNYGLNLDITVNCDYTDFILENRKMFADLFGYGVAMQIMKHQLANPYVRLNRSQKNAQIQAPVVILETEGSDERPGGIRKEFDTVLERLSFDMSGIDPICLPCRKRGVDLKVFH